MIGVSFFMKLIGFLSLIPTGYFLYRFVFEPTNWKYILYACLIVLGLIVIGYLCFWSEKFTYHHSASIGGYQYYEARDGGQSIRLMLIYLFLPLGVLAIGGLIAQFFLTRQYVYLKGAGMMLMFIVTVLFGYLGLAPLYRIPGIDYL